MNKFKNKEEYYQYLCDVLNENGFKKEERNELVPWNTKNPEFFMSQLGASRPIAFKAFSFLKNNGYFNMGICPECGDEIYEIKYSYTHGLNPKINYPICRDCYEAGRDFSINPNSDKRGCYIATVCYGNPNTSEVKLFRRYRDEVLSNSLIGRVFISTYYLISPVFADFLKGKRTLNKNIRILILDRLYNNIKSKYKHLTK